MAKLNRTNDVDQSVTALVHLLEEPERNGVFIRLGDELESLRKYMIIQNYRYDHQIELRIDCLRRWRAFMFPGCREMIVENAIFHGIARLMKGASFRSG